MIDEQRQRSNDFYCFAMCLVDAGASQAVVDPLIEELCDICGIGFPPEQLEVLCQ